MHGRGLKPFAEPPPVKSSLRKFTSHLDTTTWRTSGVDARFSEQRGGSEARGHRSLRPQEDGLRSTTKRRAKVSLAFVPTSWISQATSCQHTNLAAIKQASC